MFCYVIYSLFDVEQSLKTVSFELEQVQTPIFQSREIPWHPKLINESVWNTWIELEYSIKLYVSKDPSHDKKIF